MHDSNDNIHTNCRLNSRRCSWITVEEPEIEDAGAVGIELTGAERADDRAGPPLLSASHALLKRSATSV